MPELHTLLADLAFGESPRWHAGRLWVADWGAQEILAVDHEGRRESIVKVDFPAFPMCFDWLPNGQLLLVSSRNGLLLRMEADGELVTHADLSDLARKGLPWNEIVVDGRSNIYLNNTGFDFPAGAFAPGTIALLSPDGTKRQVADGLAFPNGMAVTADNSTLIVAESYGNKLTAFDIEASGSLSHRRVWAETGNDHPDGICLDAEGAIWYADVGNRRCVRIREGGEVLQTIELDRGGFACMLGGDDGKTLYIVATEWKDAEENMGEARRTGQVFTLRAPAPHAGWP
ncbi:SMP-30/gluconolactonase/LRE family protein [Ktedonosporobacter rubrisoli]|uniref:SMP-30/gluconolactonase/LRE family protein n=1 Tax=Ktedonosporobacter rubrisoli TaxID=2509675 RepID=A0A4P6JWY5_KTERU|nr:SMP-30/gluconolactonase/LRE family protein [Ktedonosporobacter rubrisoli]QBD79536.1 SMP-30/gluconolactonase/LRE family protein [Ktedonosporobacter rubrisoli]